MDGDGVIEAEAEVESSGWESDIGSDDGHNEGNGGRWDDGTDEDFINAETVAQQ